MQTVLVQGRGQDGSDLMQQPGVVFNRSETVGDSPVVVQKAAGVLEVFRHEWKSGLNGKYY